MGELQFHGIELGFLGEDLIDIRLEAGISVEESLAQAALHRGLDF